MSIRIFEIIVYKETDAMKLAMYQMKNAGSIQDNLIKSIDAIKEAADAGMDLILFPEVQLTEFFPQYRDKDVHEYEVSIDSDIVNALREACKKNHIMAVPNIYLYEDGKTYDASILIDRTGEILGVQKMVHVAQAENFYEQDYYTPSDTGFNVFETDIGKIGIVVCFDRHYPESIRTEVLMGADLILIPTVNTLSEPMKMFETELCAQAFQNSVWIAMCKRVGKEDNLEFAGESLIIDADGKTKLKADSKEQLICTELNLEDARKIRASKPYTSLRRKEWYL